MNKITCTRKIHFCSGHRVLHHEGKCRTPHGHNYTAHIVAEASKLDPLGRVIDFSVLKEKIGTWIDTYWDHNFIVFENDEELLHALGTIGSKEREPFVAPFNPTAENMAYYLLQEVCPKLLETTGVVVTKIILYETDNCYVEASC